MALRNGAWGFLHRAEIADSAEFTEGARCPISVGIGFTAKEQDGDLKTAATDAEEQKEITGIARRGI
jgi:hypothetical protein